MKHVRFVEKAPSRVAMIRPDRKVRMSGRWLIAAALILAPTCTGAIRAQQSSAGTNGAGASGAAAKPEPPRVGSYSLVVTTIDPTESTHLLNPPPPIDVKAGSRLAPAETTGSLTIPQQYTIEAFGKPKQECDEEAQQQHGCDALDRVDFAIRDLNTVEYRILTHGPAVTLRVNLEVHDLVPASHGGPGTDWHSGDVLFVSVPKATATYRFVSETLVGEWNGEAIVFEAGKALPASAKKGLEDLEVHQDLGDAVLYSYRVK